MGNVRDFWGNIKNGQRTAFFDPVVKPIGRAKKDCWLKRRCLVPPRFPPIPAVRRLFVRKRWCQKEDTGVGSGAFQWKKLPFPLETTGFVPDVGTDIKERWKGNMRIAKGEYKTDIYCPAFEGNSQSLRGWYGNG